MGRINESKGVKLLLKAWEIMGKTAPELIICGTGPLEDWCRKYIRKHELNVDMLGFIPNAEVKTQIANSKALILPTQWYEGFPMVILEAFSVGTPVICANHGNVGSIVIERVSGWKFHDLQELILCIRKAEIANLKESVRNYYQEYFSSEVNYMMLSSIYDSLKPVKVKEKISS